MKESEKQKLKQLTVRLDHDRWLRLRIHLLKREMSMQKWLEQVVDKEIRDRG